MLYVLFGPNEETMEGFIRLSSHSVHPRLSAGVSCNLLPNFQKGVAWQDLNF